MAAAAETAALSCRNGEVGFLKDTRLGCEGVLNQPNNVYNGPVCIFGLSYSVDLGLIITTVGPLLLFIILFEVRNQLDY